MTEKIRLLIVTGMLGAGKTQVLQSLEDMGYFCVDNLPPVLISKFALICQKSIENVQHVALVVDIRSGDFFDALEHALKELGNMQVAYEVVFLEATDEMLIRRYKETRRVHPLAPHGRIQQGIVKERKILDSIKKQANYVIDTTDMKTATLRDILKRKFSVTKPDEGLVITVVSFGFKFGIPLDLDIMFDVRFLPNPFYIEEYRNKTGRVPAVSKYIAKWDVTQEFMKRLTDLFGFLMPNYEKEGKEQLVIGIGCTGGMHRSVWVVENVCKYFSSLGLIVNIEHRDMMKNSVEEDFPDETKFLGERKE